MSSNTEKWYLKIAENQVFGPASLDTLITWAADGRIAPDHTISDSRKHWSPASTLADLELEWEVHLDNGERYGPIHIQAIRDLLFNGQASWSTPLFHIPSKRECTVQNEAASIFGASEAIKQAPAAKAELAKRDRQISKLKKQQCKLETSLTDLRSSQENSRHKVDQLTDETEALNKTISDLNGKNKEQQATINTQAADIKSAEQALAAQNAATENQQKALEQKLISSEQDYQNLKTSTQVALDKWQITVADLTTQLDSTRGALAESAEALKTEQQQRMDACGKSERLQHDLQISRDEATTLKAEVERQQTVIHGREQQEPALQQDLSQHTKHMESEMATWEQREEMLHRKIDQLQERCEIALSESRELHVQLEKTRKAPEEAQKTPTVNPLQHLERQAQEELKRWIKKR
jgi:chromosome segregation ATPase